MDWTAVPKAFGKSTKQPKQFKPFKPFIHLNHLNHLVHDLKNCVTCEVRLLQAKLLVIYSLILIQVIKDSILLCLPVFLKNLGSTEIGQYFDKLEALPSLQVETI